MSVICISRLSNLPDQHQGAGLRRLFWLALALLFSFSAAGCGQKRLVVYPGSGKLDLSNAAAVRTALYDQYRQWRGVPYRPGGMDSNGVDCSAFVLMTYHSRFGIALPRTTREQAAYGREIPSAVLQPGDLVFFKTGSGYHIGIYLENRQFMHVSTKRGVKLSRLDDRYWRERFWQARRLLQ